MVRRWIHHAQLELIPVIVPPGAEASAIVVPPGATVLRRMAKDVYDLSHPQRRARLAVLSFDDGPYPVTTPALLEQLHVLKVPAVFFLIGDDVTRQPAIARRVARAGMEVENHSLTHPEVTTLSLAGQIREIAGGEMAIQRVTGVQTSYFRPPHGNYDAGTIVAAQLVGQTVALWDVDPGDWRTLTADQIVDLCEKQAHAPAIILLHSGKEATIEALPRIVAAYRRAGFTFVTLAQLRSGMPLEEINNPFRVHIDEASNH